MRDAPSSGSSWLLWILVLFLTCDRCTQEQRITRLEQKAAKREYDDEVRHRRNAEIPSRDADAENTDGGTEWSP